MKIPYVRLASFHRIFQDAMFIFYVDGDIMPVGDQSINAIVRDMNLFIYKKQNHNSNRKGWKVFVFEETSKHLLAPQVL